MVEFCHHIGSAIGSRLGQRVHHYLTEVGGVCGGQVRGGGGSQRWWWWWQMKVMVQKGDRLWCRWCFWEVLWDFGQGNGMAWSWQRSRRLKRLRKVVKQVGEGLVEVELSHEVEKNIQNFIENKEKQRKKKVNLPFFCKRWAVIFEEWEVICCTWKMKKRSSWSKKEKSAN